MVALNTLFGILQRLEGEFPSGKLVVSRPPGIVAGIFKTYAGKIQDIRAWEPVDDLKRACAEVLSAGPLAGAANLTKRECARILAGQGGPVQSMQSGLRCDGEQAQALVLRHWARQCHRIAECCGEDEPEFLHVASDLTSDPANDSAGGLTSGAGAHGSEEGVPVWRLFVEISAIMDPFPEDAASALYDEFSRSAEASLLLIRPANAEQLPAPIRCAGLTDLDFADLVPLCQAAAALSQPPGLQSAGIAPTWTTMMFADGFWLAGIGARRFVLLRFASQRQAVPVLARLATWTPSLSGREEPA